MASVLIFCTLCDTGYAVIGVIPRICPECLQETFWTTTLPWRVNFNDKKFLRSIHVAP